MLFAASLHPALGPSDWWFAAVVFAGLAAAVLLLWPVGARIYRAGLLTERSTAVPARVRHTYLVTIGEVEKSWQAGELSDREVAHRLSEIVRDFARDAWNLNIGHMTLRELKAFRLGTVAEVVERLYADEFAREEPANAGTQLARVRGLIDRWS
ncbi:hypothetical protein M3B11_04235 [Brevibacterium sp. p3-SID960]|uniref:hypothetical protein n=1 Tax=Brevibacterium sp. p3-SID960 TaxID=2916063 RepID=UPI0021A6700D|nr:hypothetical protein [Brevibacterium sp. p3-SID960]MCT1690170.1 hypothetical protein [Brevibacterium sp. p3-SID960]